MLLVVKVLIRLAELLPAAVAAAAGSELNRKGRSRRRFVLCARLPGLLLHGAHDVRRPPMHRATRWGRSKKSEPKSTIAQTIYLLALFPSHVKEFGTHGPTNPIVSARLCMQIRLMLRITRVWTTSSSDEVFDPTNISCHAIGPSASHVFESYGYDCLKQRLKSAIRRASDTAYTSSVFHVIAQTPGFARVSNEASS